MNKCKNIIDEMVCNREVNGEIFLKGIEVCNYCWRHRKDNQGISKQMKKLLKRQRREDGD